MGRPTYLDREIDEVIEFIKINHSDTWSLFQAGYRAAAEKGLCTALTGDPSVFVADRVLGQSDSVLRVLRLCLADSTPTEQELLGLAAAIVSAMPRHYTALDTFTEEDKKMAVQVVKDALPEEWERMVLRLGGQMPEDDDPHSAKDSLLFCKTIEHLPIDWGNEKRLNRIKIMYRHVT